MQLYGLLCFYDEPPNVLISCLRGLERAGVKHVIAVDGAYRLYPEGANTSHPNQHAALDLACMHMNMGLTLHVPEQVWEGNEVQKRTKMFDLAWAVAEEGDWFFVMDADQEIKEVPDDFHDRLKISGRDVAETYFVDTMALAADHKDWPPYFTVRNLFRAQPIHLDTNHISYGTADGRWLWGDASRTVEPCLDMTDLLIEHHPDKRPDERQKAKLAYYSQREEQRIERGNCALCQKKAARHVATKWRLTKIGPVGDWVEACETCATKLDKRGRYELIQLGVNPDQVRIENRNGGAPDKSKHTGHKRVPPPPPKKQRSRT